MAVNISRRTFLKDVSKGTLGLAAASVIGVPGALAEEAKPFEGKMQFAGTHNVRHITEDLLWLGASDQRIALFENVYPVPRGISYNAYLLLDEKTVLFDTVDRSVAGQFFENLTYGLQGRTLDYIVVHHLEPDHSAMIAEVVRRYPDVQIVCTELAATMLKNFQQIDVTQHGYTVSEGMGLNVGRHSFVFTMAPMVHWPEVMMTYDATTGTLFSADAFGTFGAIGGNLFADEVKFETEWIDDARRYYCNIVGKYGPQVQDVLAKAGTLDIRMVCPLHGPIWRENIGWFVGKYDQWSRYEPEEKSVLVVYGSIYGGTENAAALISTRLSMGGQFNVVTRDVSKTHVSELIAEAFRCSHIVLASATYNNEIFTPMKNFLGDLAAHNLQGRTYALIENGSWSPVAGAKMKAMMDAMPGMRQVGETVTIHSTPNEENYEQIVALAEAVLADLAGASESAPAVEEVAGERWKCTVCGYIHEGALPEDFKCPVCNVGPDKFERVE